VITCWATPLDFIEPRVLDFDRCVRLRRVLVGCPAPPKVSSVFLTTDQLSALMAYRHEADDLSACNKRFSRITRSETWLPAEPIQSRPGYQPFGRPFQGVHIRPGTIFSQGLRAELQPLHLPPLRGFPSCLEAVSASRPLRRLESFLTSGQCSPAQNAPFGSMGFNPLPI